MKEQCDLEMNLHQNDVQLKFRMRNKNNSQTILFLLRINARLPRSWCLSRQQSSRRPTSSTGCSGGKVMGVIRWYCLQVRSIWHRKSYKMETNKRQINKCFLQDQSYTLCSWPIVSLALPSQYGPVWYCQQWPAGKAVRGH